MDDLVQAKETARQYLEDAKRDLKNKLRFSNNTLDRLVGNLDYQNEHQVILEKKQIIYRGRNYTKPDAELRFNRRPKPRFQGYNRKESFLNLDSKTVREGRCNPDHILCLYAAESPDCCIYELRPNVKNYISIAKLRILEDIKLLDLRPGIEKFPSTSITCLLPGTKNVFLLDALRWIFSEPEQESGDYIISQYITEKAKELGYDGVAYQSAVYSGKGATNYAIFNYDKCNVISSKLYCVGEIKIEWI